MWTCLGLATPRPRLVILTLFAAAFGLIPPYYLNGSSEAYAFFLAAAVAHSAIVAASLLVVRARGDRLVRRPPKPAAAGPATT
ncbi:MAG: hypothetical protein WD278_20510 [Pirellulales bacterium]